jgi:hypothetical protein
MKSSLFFDIKGALRFRNGRKAFDALDPVERHRKIVKEGYAVFDQPIERRPNVVGAPGTKTMSRKDFDALHPFEKAAKIKAGFTLFDEN